MYIIFYGFISIFLAHLLHSRIAYRRGTLLLSPRAAAAAAPRSYPTPQRGTHILYNSRTTEQ
jgi:hypothetical protein